MSILLIEDDDGVRESLAELFAEEGYLVDVVNDGSEAVRFLSACTTLPGLIILDLMMPTMDGAEFRRAQLDNPAWAAIPTIVLSARPDTEARAASMGVEDWLKKPLSFDELLHIVQNRAHTSVAQILETYRPK